MLADMNTVLDPFQTAQVRVKEVQVLSDDWYICSRRPDSNVQPSPTANLADEITRETYDRGNGATMLLYNLSNSAASS